MTDTIKIHCKYDELQNPKSLKDHPKNRNKHSKDQIDRLAKLYAFHGIRHPIIVSNLSGCIVAGHGRKQAGIKAGLTEMPVVFQDFENEMAEYAFLQADNAIALWAELDLSGINADIPDFDPEFDIDLLGIKNFTIDPSEKLDPQCDEDDVPEARPEPKVVLGEVYILGNHRLMCGDSTVITDIEKLMNGEKAEMIFTDPPYGDDHAMSEMVAIKDRKKGSSIVSNVRKILNDTNIDFLSETSNCIFPFLENNFSAFVFFKWSKWEMIKNHFKIFGEPKTVCVWDRDSQGASTFRINPVHEFCFYWGTLGDKKETGNLRNVWRCKKEKENKTLHPTVKPIEIIEPCIRMCCSQNGNVIDLFGGSGSTMIACEKTDRHCFMMELDPLYCGVILDRWQNFTGKKAHREDGKQWDEIKAGA